MRNGGRRSIQAVTAIAVLLGAASSGLAYLDFGSGSYIFQVVIGTLVGAAVAVKLFWRRMAAFFVGKLSRKR